MNLRSENPYWLFQTPLLHTYNTLQQDLDTEIAVIGGGISGALVAYKLVRAGYKVSIISKDHIGNASTCASTSLLQYEIDTPLHELIKKVGAEHAIESYLLCSNSIDELETIHKELKIDSAFQKRKSLLIASTKKDVEGLKEEYAWRAKIGLGVEWLAPQQVNNLFGFNAPAAIYSKQGAQTNAYLLTQALIKHCCKHGAEVFDKTEIKKVSGNRRGVMLTTTEGHSIKARYAVMATGYETVNWIDRNFTRLHSTYVIISEPVAKETLWKDKCLIWETARPYVYLRTTADNRIIVGGKDEPFYSAHKRDALLKIKSKQLLAAFYRKFPGIAFNIEFTWAGTFAETRDGLPFIGTVRELPNVFFALGFGGNGITFSQIAAGIIANKIADSPAPESRIFGFDRKISV